MIFDLPTQWPPELLEWIGSGKISAVTKYVFALKDIEQAMDLSRSHRATGKIVLNIVAPE
jgi:NADPH:quinone reductase-like Zn-dependent oxidoreductase